MKRLIFFAYGVICHLMFLAVFTYMALFVGNLFIPHTIDTVVEGTSTSAAVTINLLLLALFAVSHSVMARPAFKEVWTQVIPKPLERSTYVLVSNLVCIVLMWQWCGIDTLVWDIQQPALRAVIWVLFVGGWLLVPVVSLLINHFDLFGTRQVWLYFKGQDYQPLPFREPLFYKRVRHPLYIGWAIAFWAIPTMTAGHLLFASTLTVYMMIAAVIEERDLIEYFGKQYEEYRSRVPMFVPSLKIKK
jgi:protein-S-isoprenylcysteine O-methyltransferase Ste14